MPMMKLVTSARSRRGLSDQALLEVAPHGFRTAPGWIAPAAAAARMHLQHITRRDDDADLLGLQDALGLALADEPVVMRLAVLAAEHAAGAVAHAVAGGV